MEGLSFKDFLILLSFFFHTDLFKVVHVPENIVAINITIMHLHNVLAKISAGVRIVVRLRCKLIIVLCNCELD